MALLSEPSSLIGPQYLLEWRHGRPSLSPPSLLDPTWRFGLGLDTLGFHRSLPRASDMNRRRFQFRPASLLELPHGLARSRESVQLAAGWRQSKPGAAATELAQARRPRLLRGRVIRAFGLEGVVLLVVMYRSCRQQWNRHPAHRIHPLPKLRSIEVNRRDTSPCAIHGCSTNDRRSG
jgi:hypothetical protein